jgi:sugar-specific transcriptional regulator TrmB
MHGDTLPNMDEIVKKIMPLGLNEKEARVYVALLESGRTSAYAIAGKAGLKKPTTYVILGQLIEKGLAVEIPRERKQLFAARPPEEFFAEAHKRLNAAEELLPDLKALYKQLDIGKVRTMHYDSVSGMRQALWYRADELAGKEMIGFFGSATQASRELFNLFEEWNADFLKRGVALRGVTTFDESIQALFEKFGDTHFKNIRFFPLDKFSGNVTICATEDFVCINLIGATQSVIVESKEFASTFRQIFELVWGSNLTLSLKEIQKQRETLRKV